MSGQGSLEEKKEKIKKEKYPGTHTKTWKCGEKHITYKCKCALTCTHTQTHTERKRMNVGAY